MRTRLIMCLLLGAMLVLSTALFAAYITSQPMQLTQPDGTKLSLFASGDEYYNWLHDKEGYTVKQNESGWYVYMDKTTGGQLTFTGLIAGRDNPAQSLTPWINISAAEMGQKRLARTNQIREAGGGRTLTTGTLNNLVIFIRFSDQTEFGQNISTYDGMFNGTTGNNMESYFKEASYNQLDISTTYYPTHTTTVVSWQDSHIRGYFSPYNATTNPTGYQDEDTSTLREHTLLAAAVNGVAANVPTSLNLDGDNDGKVDNVCFVIKGTNDGWAELLWPHRWVLYTFTANINGKRVYDYNLQLSEFLASSGNGVLCHEMFHSLGSPDLYHYTSDGISPVGGWDLMESNANPPEHMSAYMKYKYGHWIAAPAVISTSGTYTLNPLSSSTGNIYRINSPASSTQFFVVEFRKKTGTFESSVPGSGMIIYRINTAVSGNASGPPDEVYAFRPGGTTTVNGTINSANFSTETGRTSFSSSTNPSCFLQDGTNGNIAITNISSSAGSTMSFYLGVSPIPSNLTGTAGNATVTLNWQAPPAGNQTGYKIYKNSAFLASTTALTYTDNAVSNGVSYTYYVTATYSSAPTESGASNSVVLVPSSNPLITIGNGTSTQRMPFGMWYGYERDASLLLSSEVGSFGTIISLNWYVSASAASSAPVTIRLKSTTATSLVSDAWATEIGGATTVYSNSLSFPNTGWQTITLTTPFAYTSGNLLVLIETNYGGAGIGTYPLFNYTATVANLHQTWYADTTAPSGVGNAINTFRPNIQIQKANFNAPTGLTAIASYTMNNLSWTAPLGSSGTLSGYKIFRNNTLITPSPIGATSYTDTGLTNGTICNYYVTAVYTNPAGESAASVTASATPSSALPIAIGTGTATNQNLPIEPYFGYTYSQSLYQPSEINLTNKRIYKLAWKFNGFSAWSDAIKIWMGNTATTSFATTTSWLPITGMTLVYDGALTVPASAGWVELTLNTPFVYNNANNLSIAVDENTAGFHTNSDDFYCTAVTGNRSIYYRSDSVNPDPVSPVTATAVSAYIPNVKLFFEDIPPAPVFHVEPDSIAFGTIELGQNSIQQLTVTDPTASITSISIDNNAVFQLLNLPATYPVYLAQGDVLNFNVRYNPIATGTQTAIITITDNQSRTPHYVNVRGSNLDNSYSIPFIENFSSVTFPPVNWTRYAGLLSAPSTLTLISTGWVADGFGNIGLTGAARKLIYNNNTDHWLVTPAINLGAGNPDLRLEFDVALTLSSSNTAANTTGIDDKFAVVISTDNGSTWTQVNTLKLWNNAGSADVYNNIPRIGTHVMVPLSAYTGRVKIGFYGESTITNASNDLSIDNISIWLPGPPCLSLSANTLSESLFMGNNSLQHLTMENTGELPLVYSIQIAEPQRTIVAKESVSPVNRTDRNVTWLTCSSLAGTIAAGQSLLQDISFISANTVPGMHQAEIIISSNDPLQPVQFISVNLDVLLDNPTVHISLIGDFPRISWQQVPGANVYKIYRSNASDSGFTQVTTTTNTYYDVADAQWSYYKIVSGYE